MFTIKIISSDGNVKLELAENIQIFKKDTVPYKEHESANGVIDDCVAYLFELSDDLGDFGESSEIQYKQCIAVFSGEKCYITDSGGNTVEIVG